MKQNQTSQDNLRALALSDENHTLETRKSTVLTFSPTYMLISVTHKSLESIGGI